LADADVPFWCLFWPVAHDSFLNHMLGIPWQNMVSIDIFALKFQHQECCRFGGRAAEVLAGLQIHAVHAANR
jgi:hypothetical protein